MSNSRRKFVSSSAILLAATAGNLAVPTSVRAACGPSNGPITITRIEVEVWTGNGEYDRTNDPVDCRIHFQNGCSFQQGISNPNVDDRELGRRDRYRLDLTTIPAKYALYGQTANSISAVEIIKRSGANGWRCVAVGLRVNNVVVLSRSVNHFLDEPGGGFTVNLRKDGTLDGLELVLRTANSHRGGTDDAVYCNVVFSDGTQLYPTNNLYLNIGPEADDFDRNNAYSTYAYLLPLDGTTTKTPADIGSVYVRKEGTDGWLLQSAHLYANGDKTAVIANRAINQFLDSSMVVLKHQDWSSASLAVPPDGAANTPLPASTQYRICGPVLGHTSAHSTKVLYRVEREDTYRVTLFEKANPANAQSIDLPLRPTGTFSFTNLKADTEYDFKFFRMTGATALPMTEGDGTLRTLPAEGQPVRFSFAFGSCAHNGHHVDDQQPVWESILQAASGSDPVRFFVHLGDTTYFYDDVSEKKNDEIPAFAAGHLASRKHNGFQAMARKVPCYAVWDDHDFRFNNSDASHFLLKTVKRDAALRLFHDYWGNPNPLRAAYGLTTRFSYGNVDFYLMDGRFNRFPGSAITAPLFGKEQCDFILEDIKSRGPNRMRVLMSGSLWNNITSDPDNRKSAYGNPKYAPERVTLFTGLGELLGTHIEGLVLLSGDVHINQIFEVNLGTSNKVAPEFVCSPLTMNSGGTNKSTGSERKWCAAAQEPGFAVVTIDTTGSPWTLKVQFRRANGDSGCAKTYSLANSQFLFSSGTALSCPP